MWCVPACVDDRCAKDSSFDWTTTGGDDADDDIVSRGRRRFSFSFGDYAAGHVNADGGQLSYYVTCQLAVCGEAKQVRTCAFWV